MNGPPTLFIMKLLVTTICLCFATMLTAQYNAQLRFPAVHGKDLLPKPAVLHESPHYLPDIRLARQEKWRLTGNHYLTGGLIYLAGASKGFNETLMFNWNGFHSVFPKANSQWFWPTYSFKNKYKDGDPSKGPKFPFSTSLLVMTTDQYHLNNFIFKASITSALVIKIGEKKKPFKHYLFDLLYYSACYQAGFASVYYPFKWRN